jgi:predicted lipid-binding transport protein (Tim44 family)
MSRMGRPQPVAAGPAGGRLEPPPLVTPEPAARPMARTGLGAAAGGELAADGTTRLAPLGGAGGRAANLPADFDGEGFARIAKMVFIRMQAANDAGDLNDLRSFTTPEMFAVARLDIQDRGARAQATDVVQVDAEALDFEQEGERQIVSVRFHGKIREEADGPVTDFDEVWHLQRWSHDPNWKVAGIQQQTVH